MKLYNYSLEECDGKLYFHENEIEVDEQITDNKFFNRFVKHYNNKCIPDSEYITDEVYVILENDDWGYHQETSSYIYLQNKCKDLKGMKENLRKSIVLELRKEMDNVTRGYQSTIKEYSNYVILESEN